MTPSEPGNTFLADGLLEKAIDAYLSGFEADWRDAYPGINALALMEMREPPDPRHGPLIPEVSYAVERRLASREADYWDHATRLELAVLAKDEANSETGPGQRTGHGAGGLGARIHSQQPQAHPCAREHRKDDVPWAEMVERELLPKTGQPLMAADST